MKKLTLLLLLTSFFPAFAGQNEQMIIAVQQAKISALDAKLEALKIENSKIKKKLDDAVSNNNTWLGSPTGLKGDKGDKGDAGTNGINGTNGANGSQGPQGVQGAQGPAGPGTMIHAVIDEGRSCQAFCAANNAACVAATFSTWDRPVACTSVQNTLKRCICLS